jgi:hypothetical protein
MIVVLETSPMLWSPISTRTLFVPFPAIVKIPPSVVEAVFRHCDGEGVTSTSFALDLRLACRKAGDTQHDPAHLIAISPSVLCQLEGGKRSGEKLGE